MSCRRTACTSLAFIAPVVQAHGALTLPKSRNGMNNTQSESVWPECNFYTGGIEIPGKATVVDPALRTEPWLPCCTPWRAPGTAPTVGPCGTCHEAELFCPNGFVDGRDLPPTPRSLWTAGSDVEVAWAINANHGGGYIYRLCPSDMELTEECFERMPLDFVGDTTWIRRFDDNSNGTTVTAKSTDQGVGGSTWRMNPIPDCETPEDEMSCPFPKPMPSLGGHTTGAQGWNIVDLVHVPDGLPSGNYVLQWRWDCEETTQVWENCADIEVLAVSTHSMDAISAVVLL